MGQFAATLFRVLLGWVQNAAAWLWSLFTNKDTGVWMDWIQENWLPLTLLLCLLGVLVDFLVYLLRWQPYRVWGSYLRRRKERETAEAKALAEPVAYQRKWIYADGSTEVEDVRPAVQESTPDSEPKLDAPVRPTRRVARRASLEQAYYAPVYPPQWQGNTQENQGENE